jgi:dTDP-4-amino-4,6-dideoxygalactose transaminase
MAGQEPGGPANLGYDTTFMSADRVPLLDLKAQFAPIRAETLEAITRVCDSQQFILGPEVEALERELASFLDVPHAIGVSSGTDALLAALMALDIGPGDEVVTTPFSFFSTAGSIARLGARPVFVDIDAATFNIDARAIEAAVSPKTKAIVPVHLFGLMTDMPAISEIASRHSIPVVEDAAQAIGAEWSGRRAGSVGTLGCLSFFPSKNLGAFGDAGMVLTSDEALAARVRRLRNHGQEPKYFADEIGGNFRMDALQGAVLRAKLPSLEAWTEARRRNAAAYRRLFGDAGLVEKTMVARGDAPVVLPAQVPGTRHVFNQFVLRVQRRDALRAFLSQQGIESEVYYPRPLHLQECFAAWDHRVGDYPQAERVARESLALPIYPELTPPMQEAVVSSIARFYGH